MIFCVKSLIVEAFFTSKRIAFHITGPEYDRLSLNKRVLGIGLVKLFLKRTVMNYLLKYLLLIGKDLFLIYWGAIMTLTTSYIILALFRRTA